MYDKKYLKDVYLLAREAMDERTKAKDVNIGTEDDDPKYSMCMLRCLRDMAENDVYPDGRFGDDECRVWSMFHSFHMTNKD